MNTPTLHTGITAASAAGKRRYSSTAVEFPIRIDQRPHSQGVSRGFPSWERARRAPTYVSGHVIACISLSNLPQQNHGFRCILAATTATTPTEARQKSIPCACHTPDRFMGRTCLVPGSSKPEPKQVRPISLSMAGQVLSLSSPRPHQSRSCSGHRAHQLLPFSLQSSFQLPTSAPAVLSNVSRICLELVWESLGNYLKSCHTLAKLALYSFSPHSRLIRGSFLVRWSFVLS